MPEPRIWILPPEVSDRIAAGEVVERPASVVKEMVENSLDAGATRILVETEAGGKDLIRITDDGCGMSLEEVGIALQRHATSKLRLAEDLFNLHTLGFRGEALPSIAAVSELEILTRPAEAEAGTRIRVLGGVVQGVEPAPAPIGTQVTVRRLFFNVPVREKFLRSNTTEATQITEWLQRLALSRPTVGFRLMHSGREALLSPGSQDPLNTVVAVLGRAVAREMIKLEPAGPLPPGAEGVVVSGFIGRPTLTRSNRSHQHTYVNGRSVRSPIFYRALEDSYRATMPQGRHPAALLFMEVPPDWVDVNVHPAKVEVRFRDDALIHACVLRAVRAALRTGVGPLPPELAEAPIGAGADLPMPEPGSTAVAEPKSLVLEAEASDAGEVSDALSARKPPPPLPPPGTTPFVEAALGGRAERDWQGATARARFGVRTEAEDTGVGVARPPEHALPELVLLGQAQDLFLLAEGGGRFWIIDQHVAHERVLFDRLLAPDAEREPGEPLLLPAHLETTPAQSLALEEHRDLLSALGFDLEPFGPHRYALRTVPRSLVGRNYETAFRDLAEELAELSQGGQFRLRKEEVAMAAAGRSCKRAVKAGQRLSTIEMERLLRDLGHTRNPHTCPHGRPVFLQYEPGDIGSLFGSRTCEE